MTNTRRFSLAEFGVYKVIPEARRNWIPINSQFREEIVFKISITGLSLQDKVWQWGSLTEESIDSIFKIEQTGSRPYEFPNDVHISVTFELNLDKTVIDRQVYSILDWLGDVGGLLEALHLLTIPVLIILQFNQLNSMLVSALF